MPSQSSEHALDLLPHVPEGQVVGVLPADAGLLVEVPGSPRPSYATVPLAAVTGWRAACSCGAWQSEPWSRVTTHGDEDLASLRVYADGAEVLRLRERPEVAALARELWDRGHLAILRAVEAVAESQLAVRSALSALDDAVLAARLAGATWDSIGSAAGMTRQSAHERWAGRKSPERRR